eukprot:scaffold142167_cov15-Prasinocladus_malaysianus.AAC.2
MLGVGAGTDEISKPLQEKAPERRSSLEGVPSLDPNAPPSIEENQDLVDPDGLDRDSYEFMCQPAQEDDRDDADTLQAAVAEQQQQRAAGLTENDTDDSPSEKQRPAKKKPAKQRQPSASKPPKKKARRTSGKGDKNDKPAQPPTARAKIKTKWTDEQTRYLIRLVNDVKYQSRINGTVEKNIVVWNDVSKELNNKFANVPGVQQMTREQTKDKYDNIRRAASSYKLKKSRNDGTLGGSGNPREKVEEIPVPAWFDEMEQAGALGGFLANSINIINGGMRSASHLTTNAMRDQRRLAEASDGQDPDSDDDQGGVVAGDQASGDEAAVNEELADILGGNALPSTQQPYGGRKENTQRAEQLANKNKKGTEAPEPKPRVGRPTKESQMLSAMGEQTNQLTEASGRNTSMIATALSDTGKSFVDMMQGHREAMHVEQEKNRQFMLQAFGMLADAMRGNRNNDSQQ